MAKRRVDLRMDEALIERIDAAAKEAGSDRTAFLETAALGLLDDSTRSPLDIDPEVNRARLAVLQGVGNCPERPGELGHVWAGVNASGDERNPCKFGCGEFGHQARDKDGRPTGPEGHFERATRMRTEIFTMLNQPASVKTWGKS
jgi:hypothetical protein